MSLTIRRVIVSGASGPLGIMMIKECLERNIEVLALVRPGSRRLKDIPVYPLVKVCEIDVNKLDSLNVSLYGPADVFFHFAWTHTGDEGRNNPILQEENISSSLKAADCAARFGCKAFVGAGSQAEYGLMNQAVDEDSPVNPNTIYGITKLAAGKLVMELCRQHGIRCNWVRVFSVYGPYENEYILSSYLIRTLLKGEEPILTPCEQVWDYLYCKDAVRAFFLVAEKAPSTCVYCLGSGKPRQLSEYAELIRDEINKDIPLGIGKKEYSPDQIMHLEANIDRIKTDVGFTPEYSFKDGIIETIDWYKSGK